MMQLQTHAEMLGSFLKLVKGCADNVGKIENISTFIDELLPHIPKRIFGHETNMLKSILIDVCGNMHEGLNLAQTYFKSSIVGILESALKARFSEPYSYTGGGSVAEEAKSCIRTFEQLLLDTVSVLMSALVRAASIFSRKSFEAAFLVAFKLEEVRKESSWLLDITVREEDVLRIHPTWSSLADKSHLLLLRIPDVDSIIENLVTCFKEISGELINRKDKVHDSIYKSDRKGLSKLVYDVLNVKDYLGDYLKSVVIDYVVGHLLELGEHLRAADEFTIENIEAYLKTVFKNSCFLEYEVYAALLEHGVPALSRLVVSTNSLEGGLEREEEEGEEEGEEFEGRKVTERGFQELDVVALVEGELWLVEVTTSKSVDDLRSKARSLSRLMSWLGAEKGLIVCTKEAYEISRELPESREVLFMSFEGLRSELHKLLRATLRRPRSTVRHMREILEHGGRSILL